MRRALLVAVVAAMAGACAPMRPMPSSGGEATASCLHLYRRFDDAVDRHAVRDGAAARIAGFPYLRVDRLLGSFADDALDRERSRAWIDQLAGLDLQARAIELANLPRAALQSLDIEDFDANARLQDCAARLTAADLSDSARIETLRRLAQVPDDYDTWKRVAGAYWLTRVPFAAGVRRYQTDVARTFAMPLEQLPVSGRLIAYGTANDGPAAGGPFPVDALGIPRPDAATLERLFATHAPVWVVDEVDENDRIGRMQWDAGPALRVDAGAPTEYRRIAHTRLGGRTLVQLVYSVWFPARPKSSALDLLGGEFDGIVWRVTLAPDGAPLIYDSIHSCGCYHQFFPTARAQLLPDVDRLEEGAFVPQRVDGLAGRLALRVAARTHFLQRVMAADAVRGVSRTLELEADDALRSLPLPEGGRRSAFGSDGIVAGSERAERFVFWPMGVRSPGAMRQWGRHATAFVGRRHFDDARLLERYFRFDLEAAMSR